MKNKDIANDIADLKLALDRLRESEIKYRTLFDSANDGIFLIERTSSLTATISFWKFSDA